jgi:pilus assembly protein CpaB
VRRRILTIALAITLAVIGTGAVLIYVKQADQRAIAGQKAVTALVATQQIPAGTTAGTALRDGMLSSQQLPASSVPSDAVHSLTSDLTGLELSGDLPAGQLLLRPMLVTTVQASSGLPIPAGKVAVTIQLCLQRAVANYVKAGSQIAVFNTFYRAPAGSVTTSCTGTNFSKGAKALHTRLVLNDVRVLSVGPSVASSTAGSGSSSVTSTAFSQSTTGSNQTVVLVTVAVSQADAERLIELAEAGIPYLALVTSTSGTRPDITIKP